LLQRRQQQVAFLDAVTDVAVQQSLSASEPTGRAADLAAEQ
jgi:hypothetical protein